MFWKASRNASTALRAGMTAQVCTIALGVVALSGCIGTIVDIEDDHCDEAECATPIATDGTRVSGFIGSSYDFDVFSFEALAGARYVIETHGSTDTKLFLLDRDGNAILRENDDSGQGSNARIEWTANIAGRYYAVVFHFDNQFGRGAYQISVTGPTNGGGPSAPAANFVFTPMGGTAPLTVQFTNTSSLSGASSASYSWSFGDGNTSTLENPVHTFLNAGRFTVRLTVSTSGGSNAKSQEIIVELGVAPNTAAENILGQRLSSLLPFGSYQLPPGAQTDPSLTVGPATGKGLSLWKEATKNIAYPEVPAEIALSFLAPNRNVAGMGIRIGSEGAVWVVPQPSALNLNGGILRASVELDNEVCAQIPGGCDEVRVETFAVTQDNRISEPELSNLNLACGRCSDQACQTTISDCSNAGGRVTFFLSQNPGARVSVAINGVAAGVLSGFFSGSGPACGAPISAGVITRDVLANRDIAYEALSESGDVWRGVFSVAAGQCTRINLGEPTDRADENDPEEPLSANNILGLWQFTSGDIAGHSVEFKTGGVVAMVSPDGSQSSGTWNYNPGSGAISMIAQVPGTSRCREYRGTISGGTNASFTLRGNCKFCLRGCDTCPSIFGDFSGPCTLNFSRNLGPGIPTIPCSTDAPRLTGRTWTSCLAEVHFTYNSDGTGSSEFFGSAFEGRPRNRSFNWCIIPNGPQALIVHRPTDNLGVFDPQFTALPFDPTAGRILSFGFREQSTCR